MLPAVYLIYLSLALTTAVALVFSTFSTPALSAIFTLFIWIIGHFNYDLLQFSRITESGFLRWIFRSRSGRSRGAGSDYSDPRRQREKAPIAPDGRFRPKTRGPR